MRGLIQLNSYTLHITLYDLFFSGIIFVGLTFALLLTFVKSANRSANRLLALALLTMILWMIRVLAIDIRLENHLSLSFLLALGPLIYFYVLKITQTDYQFKSKDLLHFFPVLGEQFIQQNPILPLIVFISVIAYLYRSRQLIENFYRRLQPVQMDRSRQEFRWLRCLLAATALLWLLWIAYSGVDYFGYRNQLGVHDYYPVYIFFAVIIIWTAMAAFLRPEAGRIASPRLTHAPELKQKAAWLKSLMQTNKYYQDPELSLTSLAEKIGMTTHELSRILNTALKKSFNDFVNEYRVRKVIVKIQEPGNDNLTLLAIAYDSGFNSPSTFHRAFKEITGKTPAEYKKELPFYNLTYPSRSTAIISFHETIPKWSRQKLNRNVMFKNYLKIAMRNLKTNKGYTLVNLFALATGLTSCLVLFQYVSYEKSYDAFNRNVDQIARLRMDLHDQGNLTMSSATVFPGVAPMMKNDFPEVKNYCRLVSTRVAWSGVEPAQLNVVFSRDNQDEKSIENNGFYADPSFLQMFTVPFLKGEANTALNAPDKMVISEQMSQKYFGQDDPMGKVMTVHEGGHIYHYVITGVFENYPKNSHLAFDYLISYKTFISLIHFLGKGKEQDPDLTLGWYDFYDYLQLQPGTDLKALEAKFPDFCLRHKINSPEQIAKNNRTDFYLMSLKDIHLYSHLNEEAAVNGDSKSVSFLFLVAFIIIAIAWVNYTNLATARSLDRAREVGVRKLLGAVRADLIIQFLIESLLLNLAALVIAIGLALLLSPVYKKLLNDNMGGFGFSLPATYMLGFTGLFLAGTFLSGIYPAFVLSSYHPITVLKGAFKNSGKGQVLRKGLIIGQFATSVILIVGTIIVFQQVSFMRNQQLGASINHTLVLNGPVSVPDSAYHNAYQSFKDKLLQLGGVKGMSASTSVMGKEIYYTSGASLVHSPTHQFYTFSFQYTDYDFVPAYDIKILAGRNFSKKFATDNTTVLLNEAAVKLFGIKSVDAAINEQIFYGGDVYKVVGVLADFHHMGLNTAINPMIFVLKPYANNFYSVKFNSPNVQQTVASIQKVWNAYFPADPFSFFFLDESFDKQYKSDVQFGKVFGIFSFLAISIACFGLLSLSAYNVIQRRKEIGIRKVLGASVSSIFIMLSREMVTLVVIGILIAVPVAWFVMHLWLLDFAYRIPIQWWVFVLAGAAALLIALLTVSSQAIKAATANPVKSLRTE